MADALLVTNFNGNANGFDQNGAVSWNVTGSSTYEADAGGTLRIKPAADSQILLASTGRLDTTEGMVVLRVTPSTPVLDGSFYFEAGTYGAGTTKMDLWSSNGGSAFYGRIFDNGSGAGFQHNAVVVAGVSMLIWMKWDAGLLENGVYGGASSGSQLRGAAAQALGANGLSIGNATGGGQPATNALLGPLAIYNAGLTTEELDRLAAADLWTLDTHAPPPPESGSKIIIPLAAARRRRR